MLEIIFILNSLYVAERAVAHACEVAFFTHFTGGSYIADSADIWVRDTGVTFGAWNICFCHMLPMVYLNISRTGHIPV